jgi:tellurite resistance protein
MELFPEIDINQDQAEAIARGLYAVARADGAIHEREAALIAEFFASTTERASDLGALERAPRIEGDALALALPDKDTRSLFLKTALLLAYADGQFGVGESRTISEYAGALGVTEADQRLLEAQVKDYLLASLAHLSNTESVVEVAKELKR